MKKIKYMAVTPQTLSEICFRNNCAHFVPAEPLPFCISEKRLFDLGTEACAEGMFRKPNCMQCKYFEQMEDTQC